MLRIGGYISGQSKGPSAQNRVYKNLPGCEEVIGRACKIILRNTKELLRTSEGHTKKY